MATEYKVIIVGNSAAGKTTMSHVLIGGDPHQFSPSTIGAEYRKYTPTQWFGKRKTIGIWDTAGQPRYANIVQMYFRNCACILYCIPADANPSQYTEEMDRTMQTIREHSKPNTIMYLVITKCDLLQLPWSLEWVETWSWKWATTIKNVFYTSSYENTAGIVTLFDTVAVSIDNNSAPTQRNPDDHASEGGINVGSWKDDGSRKCSAGCVIS